MRYMGGKCRQSGDIVKFIINCGELNNMWYMGGKCRQSGDIVKYLKNFKLSPESTYIEPFCGAMWSASKVVGEIGPTMFLSDINQYLIKFWSHLLYTDDKPPSKITLEDYNHFKNNKPDDWLTAWYGFGCSFGGKWFGGLARHQKGSNQSEYDFTPQVNSTMKKVQLLKKANVNITCCSYEKYVDVEGCVFYLDPPYEDSTKGHYFDSFSHIDFWEFARKISKNNQVITSCFKCPEDFVTVHEFGNTVVRHHANTKIDNNVCEKLVVYGGI